MNVIEIPIDLQQFVQTAISSGAFQNESEVVAEGLRLLRRHVGFDAQEHAATNDTADKSFVERASRLDRLGRTDAALDLLYVSTDEMMRHGRFAELDQMLEGLRVEEFSVDMLLGILTATLPARSRLPSRPTVFSRIESVVRDRGELDEGLLAGLEA